MSVVDALANDFSAGEPAQQANATSKSGKSLWARICTGLAVRANQQAMARLAAVDPRLAAEVNAARDRAERELAK